MSGFGPLEAEWEWVVAKARPPSMLLLGRGSVTCGAFSLSRANPRLASCFDSNDMQQIESIFDLADIFGVHSQHIDVYAIISLLEPDQTC